MPSAVDALLEPFFLFLMLLVMWRSGDLRRTLSGERVNFLMVVPLVSLVSLTWLAAGKPELGGLVTYGFSRLALETDIDGADITRISVHRIGRSHVRERVGLDETAPLGRASENKTGV